jgi:hypothetical protein
VQGFSDAATRGGGATGSVSGPATATTADENRQGS